MEFQKVRLLFHATVLGMESLWPSRCCQATSSFIPHPYLQELEQVELLPNNILMVVLFPSLVYMYGQSTVKWFITCIGIVSDDLILFSVAIDHRSIPNYYCIHLHWRDSAACPSSACFIPDVNLSNSYYLDWHNARGGKQLCFSTACEHPVMQGLHYQFYVSTH